ncbi:MAG: beta-hydroxydecanoyl-ACP dehydratase, partial [Myxococcota bacterium]|nr:beta-hydroxydecanoyl-ACP dehydratase [Myxococcota bacterium]
NISRSGGMIIESFAVECWIDSVLYYTLQTVFGFFPKVALENQVGLPTSPTQRRELEDGTYFLDLRSRPERYFSGSAKLPEPMLCMLDRITAMDLDRENPFLRGEKTVDPSEWFFKAHFFQDPVQPGSLGIEAMIQLLQFYMLHVGMHTDMKEPRFQPLATEKEMVWKYRGQVLPENRLISTTMEITETGTDLIGIYAVANASLWVDGKRIYEAIGIGMRLVDKQ